MSRVFSVPHPVGSLDAVSYRMHYGGALLIQLVNLSIYSIDLHFDSR